MVKKQPKIAIVHDWLTNMGGAEKVVLAFHEAFPDAPIFTSTYTPENMPAFKNLDVRTTYLQKLPKTLRKLHKFLPILRVKAFQKLDLSNYDIILSSASAEAKQVKKTRPEQIHICYCHTPIRYYWNDYDRYKKDPGFGKLNWLIKLLMPLLVPPLKKADYKAAQQVDYFIANSQFIADRIEEFYHKKATVIHPPVDTKRFKPAKKRGNYYMTMARHIPYKRLDLAIEAANQLKLPLRVFGNGSEHEKLVAMAEPTVEFFSGSYDKKGQAEITNSINQAKGFIFPAKEDFGIVMVEALAGGTPVIAFGEGGSRDIITDSKTGVLFAKQSVDSLVDAIKKAEKTPWNPVFISNRAKRFDRVLFINKIKNFVYSKVK